MSGYMIHINKLEMAIETERGKQHIWIVVLFL